jgi:hypothetical protein
VVAAKYGVGRGVGFQILLRELTAVVYGSTFRWVRRLFPLIYLLRLA